jgi:cold shock CspA family protein
MSTVVAENGVLAMNAERIRGRVKATLPNKGFFWITGDDGVKYFAHAVQVQNGWLVLDMFEGQGCEFVAQHDDPRGPRAIMIRMEEPR